MELEKYKENAIKKVENRFSFRSEELRESLKADIEKKWVKKIKKDIETQEKQDKQNLQNNSQFHLNTALNRFNQLYCPERGIAPVGFSSNKELQRTLGPEKIFLKQVEKECGVDILINEKRRTGLYFWN